MPPRVRTTREDIIDAGYELVRKKGADALNARAIASELNCSTQPVFSNFASMDALKEAILEKAIEKYNEHVRILTQSGRYPPYKAGGMAYIKWAREEKELFKLTFMRRRKGESAAEQALFDDMARFISQSTKLPIEEARLFHLEIWAYVHGIAVMLATDYLELDEELISRTLTDIYNGLRHRFLGEQTWTR